MKTLCYTLCLAITLTNIAFAYGDTKKTVKVGATFSFEYADSFGLTGKKYETTYTITPTQSKNCIEFVYQHNRPAPRGCRDCSSATRWNFKAVRPGQQTIIFTRTRKDGFTTTESHEITVVRK